nr:MAG TPA: hypothetical protein [Caudoviricetes sp.]DAP55659.1 MAG TPA: hypothetical protein [Caudoviricetes sp.]DAU55394.1 MAG TPA: hypothetical protein [Caudoviricetes sp.]
MGIKNPIQYIHIIKLCSLVVERCKYGYLFLIMQIFIHYFANATVDGFDFLAGGCYHQDKKKERLECAVSACYSPSSR